MLWFICIYNRFQDIYCGQDFPGHSFYKKICLSKYLIILHVLYLGFSDNGQEFGGSIYQKINPQLETGISLNWSSGSSNTKFGIGAKYDLDSAASLRVKVNNSSQIGLGYQQRLRDGK